MLGRLAWGWRGALLLLVVACGGGSPDLRARVAGPLHAAMAATLARAASSSAATASACRIDARAPIFFVSERDGRPQPYVLRGSAPARRLASSPRSTFVAGVGRRSAARLLLVQSEQAAGMHGEWLATLALDGAAGRTPVRVGPMVRHLRNPELAPDGGSVLFESDAHSFRDIYRLELASGRVERLTETERGSFEPRLSPDGRRLAFTSSRDGNAEIYLLDLPRRQLQRLTWSPEDDAHPVWTPDGRGLLFVRSRRGRARIFTMAADGSHLRALRGGTVPPGEPAAERDATISPDGEFVALVEQHSGSAVVQVVRVSDGGQIGRSSDGQRIDQQPAWSPDGRQVVFVSNRTGNDELFVMARDGRCVRQLTHSPAADWLPRWARSGGRA